MPLDRSKKYEGFGLVWEWKGPTMKRWMTTELEPGGAYVAGSVSEEVMQAWLDAGHIKPVKETKIVRVEGCRMIMRDNVPIVRGWESFKDNHLVPNGAESLPVTLEFEVEA